MWELGRKLYVIFGTHNGKILQDTRFGSFQIVFGQNCQIELFRDHNFAVVRFH